MKKILIFFTVLFICLFNINSAYSQGDNLDQYKQYVHDRIKESWDCPIPLKGPMIGIKMRLNSNGEIKSLQIIKSAGYLADSATIKIIESLNPFDQFPETVDLKEADFMFFFSQLDMY